MNTVTERQQVVNHFISQTNYKAALKTALTDPPVLCKSINVKEANAKVVDSALKLFGEADIPTVIGGLEDEECDILMQYLYKFMHMGVPNGNYAFVLKLHAAIIEKCGVGSIVRCMSDRRTV